jgi:3-oxoacyl-[acyl-carrier protein] reductase
MDLGLKGKRVVVTGGTRGIGAAIVDAFLQEGAVVAFCARDKAQVAEKTAALKANGHYAHGDVCDVADGASYLEWLEQATKKLGGLDIFIPNVSAGPGQGEEGWQAAFNVDVMGAVRGCEAVLPALAVSKGAIVVIASIAGLEATGGPAPYNTAKAALISYASQLGELAGQHGVRVNSVSPGPIHVDGGFWGNVKAAQPQTYKAVADRHIGRRLGSVEEVANCVVFLSSPAASWVTRTNLIVDGGFTQRVQF